MSAIGLRADIFGSKADIRFERSRTADLCPLLGVKRTCLFASQMSAFDPKRTCPPFGAATQFDTIACPEPRGLDATPRVHIASRWCGGRLAACGARPAAGNAGHWLPQQRIS